MVATFVYCMKTISIVIKKYSFILTKPNKSFPKQINTSISIVCASSAPSTNESGALHVAVYVYILINNV